MASAPSALAIDRHGDDVGADRAQHGHRGEAAEGQPHRGKAAPAVDMLAEQQSRNGADQSREREHAAERGEALAQSQEQRDLPGEQIAGHDPAVRREQQHARAARSRTRPAPQPSPARRACPGRAGRQSTCTTAAAPNAACGPSVTSAQPPISGPMIAVREAIASRVADLLAAMLAVAERREIGVIAGPVERIADRAHDADREQASDRRRGPRPETDIAAR